MNESVRAAIFAAVAAAASTCALAQGVVRPWKPTGISSRQWESHPAFDPVTGDFYFVRSSPSFEGWRMFVSRCTASGWSEPQPPAFAGDGLEADPYFTPDGRSLYFISTRASGSRQSRDLDIWRVDRLADRSWGAPKRLPEPVNSPEAEWFPRLAPDGWLHFGSRRAGGHGGNDIWRARQDGAQRWTVENLGAGVNTTDDEYEPLLSPDGSRVIVATADGFYESRMTPHGWSARRRLTAEINASGTEIGPLWSPSERSLLFSRDTRGPDSGEFFVWHAGDPEPWPPECPPLDPE